MRAASLSCWRSPLRWWWEVPQGWGPGKQPCTYLSGSLPTQQQLQQSEWGPLGCWCIRIHTYVSTLEHYYHAVYWCWVWSDLDCLPLLSGTLHSTMPQMLLTVGVDMFLSWALASDLWASHPCFSTHLRALPSQTVTRRCWMHWGRTYNCKVCVHTVLDTVLSDYTSITAITHTYSVSIVC